MNRFSEWETEMQHGIESSICERCDDLISFLYDELGEREARDFQRHLGSCASCSTQLDSFKEVRSNVVAWRDQSLGAVMLPARRTLHEKQSALAAIRQFLNLSPLWLKGAVAFASILFFAAVAFIVMTFNAKPPAPLANANKVYSEEEMRAAVEAGVQDRLKELNTAGGEVAQETPKPIVVVKNDKPKSKSASAKTRRAPLTRLERQQLAVDLGLISPTEDSDLNLLGEQINR